MNDLLAAMMARRAQIVVPKEPVVEDGSNPPFDELTENLAYHWGRYEKQKRQVQTPAKRPEAAVLRAIKTWGKKLVGVDIARVSVGTMRTSHGFMMKLGGELGQSDIVLTPHAGQPFERQIHVEVKRPDVIVDSKKVQRAGKQSDAQKAFQAKVEARGDKYVVVTSVQELHDYMQSLGFANLPPVGRKKKEKG